MRRATQPRRRRRALLALGPLAVLLVVVSQLTGLRSVGETSTGCEDPVVVSLATTRERLGDGRFEATLRSLLRQSLTCAPRIWIWVPDTHRRDVLAALPHLHKLVAAAGSRRSTTRQRHHRQPPARSPPQVVLHLVPDVGPASKFLHTVAALTWPAGSWAPPTASVFILGGSGGGGGGGGDAASASQQQELEQQQAAADRAALAAGDTQLAFCDDDQYYAPDVLPTLLHWRRLLPAALLACRGWRVREDFAWGVSPGEYDRHVIEGWRIREPYQVGVATANKAYLARASFFKGLNLSDYSGAPPEAALVDDIWLNGHMAAAGTPRYVVPLPSASHELAGPSTLDHTIEGQGSQRWRANNVMLRHFQAAFVAESIPYRLGGRQGAPLYRPAWRRGLVRLREALLAARLRLDGSA